MSDNLAVTPGSGAQVATKDVSGVHHQYAAVEVVEDGVATPVTSTTPLPTNDDTVGGLLRRIVALLMSPRGYDKSQARQRVTAAVESGTITTVTTVTTCATVSNVAQIAGRDGAMLINPTNRTSWALNHRSRIS